MIVRPYLHRVRGRVFNLLHQAGIGTDGAAEVATGTSDEEAIAAVVAAQPDVLLIPFHAHHDEAGEQLDGLTLCRRLGEVGSVAGIPVLMPVTRMAAASLRLMSVTGEHASVHRELLTTRVLVLADEALDDPVTAARVLTHLRSHGVRADPSSA
ncbi:MAG: hypothetical protein AAF799_15955 [Myxococcota bacterium]